MSYVRMGEDGSDVYVFQSREGIECCACTLSADGYETFTTGRGILNHLILHVRWGDVVPAHVFERLRVDHPEADKEIPAWNG